MGGDDEGEDKTVPTIAAPPRAPASRERLVLGLVQGPTLADVIGDHPMRVREVVRIGTEVATLLAHLHDRDRSHGAVTPANVVLGPGAAVGLIDLEGSTNNAVQKAGTGRVPPADDVHDLGVTMTTALTGEATGTVPDDLPRMLRRVLLSATEIDPARRPTARQLADMLAWAGQGMPQGRPEPRWRTSGAAAWAFGGAALFIVLLALLGVVWLSRDDPAAPGTAGASSTATPSATAAPDTATPTTTVPPTTTSATTVPATPTSAGPTPTPTASASALPVVPTALPDIQLPTTLPALPTALPELPAEAQGLWDRFVDWLRGLF